MRRTVSRKFGAAKGFIPVSISYSTTPRLKMSLRPSIPPPPACSGLTYCSVPTNLPAVVSATAVESLVSASSSITWAIPKSRTLA